MKLRATKSWRARTAKAAELIGVDRGEVVRRALRQFRKAGSVWIDFDNYERATRANSTPIKVAVPDDLRRGLTGRQICAIVDWALSKRHLSRHDWHIQNLRERGELIEVTE